MSGVTDDLPAAPPLEVLRLDHVGLSVSNLDQSRAFYAKVFGFTAQEHAFELLAHDIRGVVLVNPQSMARIELFSRAGSQPSPAGHPTESVRRQGLVQFAFGVRDVRAGFERVTSLGATPVLTPRIAPDGRCVIAFVGDPDGNLIELIERA